MLLAVVLRLELRHRNVPITHSLANRSIAKALSEAGAKVTYEEGEGYMTGISGTHTFNTF
jgi:hypothetical protein